MYIVKVGYKKEFKFFTKRRAEEFILKENKRQNLKNEFENIVLKRRT